MPKPIPWKRSLKRLLSTRTEREVADLLGITDRCIRNWKAGSRAPHRPMQAEIVRVERDAFANAMKAAHKDALMAAIPQSVRPRAVPR